MSSDDKSEFAPKGDRLDALANALKETRPLHRVLSFMSLLEQMNYLTVSKRWNNAIRTTWKDEQRTLCLEQFWAQLGLAHTDKIVNIVRTMGHLTKLSVAYCSNLSDVSLIQILTILAQKQKEGSLISLNLFYCHSVTDVSAKYLVDHFPNLTELNLGRCQLLTEKAVELVGKLKYLKRLTLSSNPNLSEETFMLLDDGTSFPALTELDVQCSGKRPLAKYVDEIKVTRPSLKIVGPDLIRYEMVKRSTKKPQSTS